MASVSWGRVDGVVVCSLFYFRLIGASFDSAFCPFFAFGRLEVVDEEIGGFVSLRNYLTARPFRLFWFDYFMCGERTL